MFHPLIQLLAAKPQLLAGHAGAYAELAALQAGEAVRALRLRALLATSAVAALAVSAGLGGVALLLVAVVPVNDMPWPWLLVAAPAAPLLLAGALWTRMARTPLGLSMDLLRAQWAADLQLLADAEGKAP
jgi:hypothetical protein